MCQFVWEDPLTCHFLQFWKRDMLKAMVGHQQLCLRSSFLSIFLIYNYRGVFIECSSHGVSSGVCSVITLWIIFFCFGSVTGGGPI